MKTAVKAMALRLIRLVVFALGCVLLAAASSAFEAKGQHNQQVATNNRESNTERNDNTHENPCETTPEKRFSDSCAQWTSANATVESVKVAQVQTWIAGGALVVSAFTLLSAVAAALFAHKAARETENSAKAARDAVTSSRAWLCYDRCDHGLADGYIDGIRDSGGRVFMPRITNFGQSPAKNVGVYLKFQIVDCDAAIPKFQRPDEITRGMIVPPGQGLSTQFAIRTEEYNLFKKRTKQIFIYMLVLYEDVYTSDTRFTETCLKSIHNGGQIEINGQRIDHIVFAPTGDQNIAT